MLCTGGCGVWDWVFVAHLIQSFEPQMQMAKTGWKTGYNSNEVIHVLFAAVQYTTSNEGTCS